jgi:hypothetical protein
MFIIDNVLLSLIGEAFFHVQWLVSHRLNTKSVGGGAAKYTATLKSGLARHPLIKQLGQAHEQSQSRRDFQ